jgi:hypothetical protein
MIIFAISQLDEYQLMLMKKIFLDRLNKWKFTYLCNLSVKKFVT